MSMCVSLSWSGGFQVSHRRHVAREIYVKKMNRIRTPKIQLMLEGTDQD